MLASPSNMAFLLSLPYGGYLREIGWFNSYQKKEPLDADFNPIAWVTYPFMNFIEPRLSFLNNIFEYGAGNSTLYYSQFVDSVVSVEHDMAWYKNIKDVMPSHVQLFYCELKEDGHYSAFSSNFEEKFDAIIVDGRDRVNCIKKSLDNLSESGVLILDDSERESYKEGIDFLIESGFRRLDFWGISPGLFYKKCTSIFYKNNNILGI